MNGEFLERGNMNLLFFNERNDLVHSYSAFLFFLSLKKEEGCAERSGKVKKRLGMGKVPGNYT